VVIPRLESSRRKWHEEETDSLTPFLPLCNITLIISYIDKGGQTDRLLSPPLISNLYPAIFQAAAFFFLENHIEVEAVRFASFCPNLSNDYRTQTPFFFEISMDSLLDLACSLLQALHNIPDSSYHRYRLVGIKRPLGSSLTYALRIYIGISTIGSCSLLQNTSVENVETSCKRQAVFTTHASPSWFFRHRLFERGDGSMNEATLSCCCTHSFVANHTKT